MHQTQAITAFQAPPLSLLATEPLRAILDMFTHRLTQPPAVHGDGHPVVVYPGLAVGSMSTASLRSYLKTCKLDAHDWGLGVNTGPEGDFHEWLEPLAERVRDLRQQHGRRVSLVGWSLGGIYAREIAKLCPDAVRQVVTLATPFSSLKDANHAGRIYQMMGGDTARLAAQLTPELEAGFRVTPPVPTTSIFSKTDGIVCWRGCLEQIGPRAENVPVRASHIGMPTNPEVLRVLADRLAQPEDGWRPYRRPRFRAPIAPSRSRK